uniref:choline/ethanolaminephosphotransferase 1-like n=1 Tax=Styela clava TaxID=7725 RepID=UPI00193A1495|nr:choline/ethanolaminephosphotransferase 1-like [Styela clava]
MEVLTQAQLKRLEKHKYSSQGTSLLEPYFQVFWRWLVERFPLWIAPNTITIAGLIVNMASAFMIMFYSPTGTETAPSWIYLINAIGLFIYQALDAIDGKQARRTNTSSPLGELFDHGCDSISTVVVAIATACSLLLGKSPDMMFALVMSSIVLFYCGHWVSYVTGTLHFGKMDVTEVQVATMTLFTVSGIWGPDIWDIRLPLAVVNMPLKALPLFFVFGGCAFTMARFAGLIVKGGCGPNGSSVAGTSVLSPFFNMAIVFIFALTIAKKSDIMLFENHPVLYLLFFGVVGGKVTNRLVVAHMTSSELPLLDTSLLGPLLLFLNQYFNSLVNEYFLLWICMIHATVDLVQYLAYTYRQIAQHLGISIFSITPPASSPKQDGNGVKHK